MKNIITVFFFFILSFLTFGQINSSDSTVQVITYWEKGEKKEYFVSNERIKIKGSDTVSIEKTTYDVELTVLSSNDNSYTIEWWYKNINTNSSNSAAQKIKSLTEDMRIIYKTDELGNFIEVINWKEIQKFINNAAFTLQEDNKDNPEFEKILEQIRTTFTSKEAIESTSIKDIQQFHSFHGAKYKIGELLKGDIKVPNIFGKEPFDSEFQVILSEINMVENNFILKSIQEINSEQLTNATLSYLTTMASNMNIEPPKKEDLKGLKNKINTDSRINGSGWIIYSIQSTNVTGHNVRNIEERIIELK
jgi:hypothetical protein